MSARPWPVGPVPKGAPATEPVRLQEMPHQVARLKSCQPSSSSRLLQTGSHLPPHTHSRHFVAACFVGFQAGTLLHCGNIAPFEACLTGVYQLFTTNFAASSFLMC